MCVLRLDMDKPIGWFSPSPSIVWQVSLATGRLTNSPSLYLYTGPVHRVVRPVRKENDFASKVPERESNSSYTARVDPYPSALSTGPTLLLFLTFSANSHRVRKISQTLCMYADPLHFFLSEKTFVFFSPWCSGVRSFFHSLSSTPE